MTEFVHRFVPSPTGLSHGLLLLHGTGGNENTLIELGLALDPEAAILSPRGRSMEEGAPRYFRRFAESVFDEADVRRRASELAEWIFHQRAVLGLKSLIVVGFSNGANMATSLMLLHPETVDHLIAIRGQHVLHLDRLPDLSLRRVLLLHGDRDRYASREEGDRLAIQLENAGAGVERHGLPAGHTLTRGDVQLAQHWLRATAPLSPPWSEAPQRYPSA